VNRAVSIDYNRRRQWSLQKITIFLSRICRNQRCNNHGSQQNCPLSSMSHMSLSKQIICNSYEIHIVDPGRAEDFNIDFLWRLVDFLWQPKPPH
jgi:hypothetical protein